MDKKIIIPIDVYKRIEPWLCEDIGYDHTMLTTEFNTAFSIYSEQEISENIEEIVREETIKHFQNSEYKESEFHEYFTEQLKYWERYYSKAALELYLSGKQCSYPTSDKLEDIVECVLQVSKNIIFDIESLGIADLMNFTVNDITRLWKDCIKEDLNNSTNSDVLYSIMFLTGIYLKHKATEGLFDIEIFTPVLSANLKQHYRIRQDLLSLYIMFHEKDDTELPYEVNISIRYENEKRATNYTLSKYHNAWFKKMIDDYFSKKLCVPNVHVAQMEKANATPYYTEREGRPSNTLRNMLVWSVHNLIKHSTISDNAEVTNNEAEFIQEYLKLLDCSFYPQKTKQEEEMTGVQDISKNIRSTILKFSKERKLGILKKPVWWSNYFAKHPRINE